MKELRLTAVEFAKGRLDRGGWVSTEAPRLVPATTAFVTREHVWYGRFEPPCLALSSHRISKMSGSLSIRTGAGSVALQKSALRAAGVNRFTPAQPERVFCGDRAFAAPPLEAYHATPSEVGAPIAPRPTEVRGPRPRLGYCSRIINCFRYCGPRGSRAPAPPPHELPVLGVVVELLLAPPGAQADSLLTLMSSAQQGPALQKVTFHVDANSADFQLVARFCRAIENAVRPQASPPVPDDGLFRWPPDEREPLMIGGPSVGESLMIGGPSTVMRSPMAVPRSPLPTI